jgi:hypothetical protein
MAPIVAFDLDILAAVSLLAPSLCFLHSVSPSTDEVRTDLSHRRNVTSPKGLCATGKKDENEANGE